MLAFRVPDYIHHDTTEIAMWAHSGWAMGFWKHPPFLPWLVGAAAAVFSFGPTLLYVLTAAIMTVGGWAVWRIALMAQTPQAALQTAAIALLLYAALPFASGMATKFNHNSGLVAMWALTTLAFLRALDRPTLLRGALFGLVAAASMLTKYYSGLLLVSCLVASFARPDRAANFYRSPAPYVAVTVFALAMLPHALWMLDHRASTLTYAFQDTVAGDDNKRGAGMALSFAVQAPLIIAPMLIAAWLIGRFGHIRRRGSPHRFEREIVVLAALPYLATVVLTLALNLRGAVAWGMPLFVCLPAIFAARLGVLDARSMQRTVTAALAVLMVTIFAAQISMRHAVANGTDGIAEPRRAMVEEAAALWRAATGRPLGIVAGDPRLSAAATLFLPDRPLAWPAFDPERAPWVNDETVAAKGMVAFCRLRDEGCLRGARVHAAAPAPTCLLRNHVTYLGAKGPLREIIIVLIPPAGVDVAPAFSCLAAVD